MKGGEARFATPFRLDSIVGAWTPRYSIALHPDQTEAAGATLRESIFRTIRLRTVRIGTESFRQMARPCSCARRMPVPRKPHSRNATKEGTDVFDIG